MEFQFRSVMQTEVVAALLLLVAASCLQQLLYCRASMYPNMGNMMQMNPSMGGMVPMNQVMNMRGSASPCFTPSKQLTASANDITNCIGTMSILAASNHRVETLKYGQVKVSCSSKTQALYYFLTSSPVYAVHAPWTVVTTAVRRMIKSTDVYSSEYEVPPVCECIDGDKYNASALEYANPTLVKSIVTRISPARKFMMEPLGTTCPYTPEPMYTSPPESEMVYGELQKVGECTFRVLVSDTPLVVASLSEINLKTQTNGEGKSIFITVPPSCRNRQVAENTWVWLTKSSFWHGYSIIYIRVNPESKGAKDNIVEFQQFDSVNSLMLLQGK